jgi:hypothetical protein
MLIFLASCNSSATQNTGIDTSTHIIKLTDSSKAKLENALDDLIKSNTSLGDTIISGRFVNQRKYDNGDFYITIKADNNTINLLNPMPLRDDEIAKLKKDGNNITLSYNSFDKTVKFLSTQNEPEK